MKRREVWDTVMGADIHVMGLPGEVRRKTTEEKVLKE